MENAFLLPEQDSPLPSAGTRETGDEGEELAAKLLEREGFRIVAANFKAPVGRNSRGALVTGEIDLIALDGDVLCFVEVKTRSSDDFASPLTAVDLKKQRQIVRTSKVYKRLFNIRGISQRFDVVTVVLAKASEPRLELIRGFWSEERFAKKAWRSEFGFGS